MADVPQHPNRNLFLNLPIADLDRSVEFFTKLGFTFNPLFTDETATCMLVGEQAFVMLVTHGRYLEFTKGVPYGDPTTAIPAMYSVSVDSREEVDRVAETALASGGSKIDEPEDLGFMYSRNFRDPDGHCWNVLWMDPAAVEQGPEQAMETASA